MKNRIVLSCLFVLSLLGACDPAAEAPTYDDAPEEVDGIGTSPSDPEGLARSLVAPLAPDAGPDANP